MGLKILDEVKLNSGIVIESGLILSFKGYVQVIKKGGGEYVIRSHLHYYLNETQYNANNHILIEQRYRLLVSDVTGVNPLTLLYNDLKSQYTNYEDM